jgi:hypothetical protein
MTESSRRDPATELERSGDELEERLERLDDHIQEAEKKAEQRPEIRDGRDNDVAGDWKDEQDDAGDDDPKGAIDG